MPQATEARPRHRQCRCVTRRVISGIVHMPRWMGAARRSAARTAIHIAETAKNR
jgi:hypothetical protein